MRSTEGAQAQDHGHGQMAASTMAQDVSPPPTPSPFASPNRIPPRTSSHGIISSPGNRSSNRSSVQVLRPLAETDWLSQSAKSKRNSSFTTQPQGSSTHTMESHPSQPQEMLTASTSRSSPPPPPHPGHNGSYADVISGARTWTDDKERILLEPYRYLVGHPGKDIRSKFINAFNLWLKVPAEKLDVITSVVGELHTASLLVDDVQDSSLLRRGVPVAHRIFGVAQTINSANYVYFKALQDVAKLDNPKLITIFTEELLNLHRGQGMELYWRDSLICPTEDEYVEMVGNKTGGLFRLAIKLMQAESDVEIDCTPLVSTVGILFQILDDHLNLSPTSGYHSLKGLCEDLTEGKFSFPVIHAIHADPETSILTNILKQKTTDDEVKWFAIKYLQNKGSFEYSKKVCASLRAKSEELINECYDILGMEGRDGAEELRSIVRQLVVR